MLSLPVSFGGFLASAATQVLATQAPSSDFNNKADGNLNMDSFKISNLATPTADNDAVTKTYLEDKDPALKKHLVDKDTALKKYFNDNKADIKSTLNDK